MSFFKNLFKGKNSQKSASVQPPGEPQKKPEQNKTESKATQKRIEVVLEGDDERSVWTYDGAPLKGTRKGSVFYVDVVTTPVVLKSTLTGSTWNSVMDDGTALAYNGRPFGITNAMQTTFRELAQEGYSVKVKAKRLGMYDKDIPSIAILLPNMNEVYHWRDACKALGRHVPFDERHSAECDAAAEAYGAKKRLEWAAGRALPDGAIGVVLNFDEKDWKGPRPGTGSAAMSIETSWAPVPKGSKAKPHIVVRENGKEVADVGARSHQYATLSEHVEERPYLAVCRKLDSIQETGEHYWKLVLVYLPKEEVNTQ